MATLAMVAVVTMEEPQTAANPPQAATELREIERLMDAFVGELSKLDEILDVLTAHVDRMRSRSARAEDGTVH